MSKIKVNRLENTATTDGGINIDTSGHVQVDGLQMPTAGALSNRNLIINGAMTVAQRGTSITDQTVAAYRTCDRYLELIGSLGTWTSEQHTDAPPGFSNSLKLTCTTADASPVTGGAVMIIQRIEGQNIQHLNYGTANAAPTIISFWVKSNKTGNASFGVLAPDGGHRLFNQAYNISSANTWEYKTIAIPADIAGTINNDNGDAFNVEWWLNSGSTFSSGSHQTAWGPLSQTSRNASNLGVGGTVSDYFQITGVQLEVGSKATSFEHESYGQTLAKCQRYFYAMYNAVLEGTYDAPLANGCYYTTNKFFATTHFPTTMRVKPTMTASSGSIGEFIIYRNNTANNLTTLVQSDESLHSSEFYASPAHNAVGTINWPGFLRATGNTSYVFFESEL